MKTKEISVSVKGGKVLSNGRVKEWVFYAPTHLWFKGTDGVSFYVPTSSIEYFSVKEG